MSENVTNNKESKKSSLTALERLEQIEKFLVGQDALNKHLLQNLQRLSNMSQGNLQGLENLARGLDAAISMLGKKELVSLEEINNEQESQDIARKKQTEESLIEKGLFTEGLSLSTESVAVVKQTGEDGKVLSSREFVEISKLGEDVKNLFLGKCIGDILDVQNTKVEILRVLEPVSQGSLEASSEESSESSSENSSESSEQASTESSES